MVWQTRMYLIQLGSNTSWFMRVILNPKWLCANTCLFYTTSCTASFLTVIKPHIDHFKVRTRIQYLHDFWRLVTCLLEWLHSYFTIYWCTLHKIHFLSTKQITGINKWIKILPAPGITVHHIEGNFPDGPTLLKLSPQRKRKDCWGIVRTTTKLTL